MKFFRNDDWLREMLWGATFDDFLIRPGWGKAKTRKGISLKTKFSQNVSLNIPIVSANMDTITRARMAVAMAKEGGMGIIERYLNIDEQRKRVEEVKREENFVITQPYSISRISTIGQAREVMAKNKVGSLVVVDEDNKLAGILSSRDMRFVEDGSFVSERMTPVDRLVTARKETTLIEAKKLLDNHRLEKIPLIDEESRLVGLVTSKDIENLEKYPLANKDANGQLIVGAAIGAVGDYLERTSELVKAKVDVIVMDIANFQSDLGAEAAINFRKKFPSTELVIGNVALPEAVKIYQDLGVNGIKIGLGPGSACTTRRNTNIGVPQAEAIYYCFRNAEVPLIADGGIRRNGHISLALLLGGDSVMIGGLFAGTDETPGLVFRKSTGQRVKTFRGMASREAMYARLRAEESDNPYEISSRISPEGIEKDVEARGSVVPIIREIIGNVASTVSYLGATSLVEAKEMFLKNARRHLVKISESSKRESWER